MASVFSRNLQIYNAEQFKASVDDTGAPHIYLTFGKVDAWADENSPNQANTSVVTFYEVWDNMVGAKKVVGNNVKLGIRRNDWANNTVYTAYDDHADSRLYNDANIKYCIVTSDWNVYKCLSNNKGAVSTVMPTSTSTTSAVQTADNYIWKYMYSLTDEERLLFTTDQFIPVRTLTEDNGSSQWQVQQNAIAGAIEHIKVVTAGSGYNPAIPPTIVISGDGKDATATATVNATSTGVESITVTNKGSGYTYATVTIEGGGLGAVGEAEISPPGGHGSNPVEELGATYAIINVRLENSESNVLDIENEFRQVTLLKNPKLYDSTTLATGTVYSQMFVLTMEETGSSNFVEDEYVFQGASLATATFKGKVVSWDGVRTLKLTNVFGNPTTSVLNGDTSKAVRAVSSVTYPSLEPYTGSLLYIDNIKAIQRASDQTEDFKIVISF